MLRRLAWLALCTASLGACAPKPPPQQAAASPSPTATATATAEPSVSPTSAPSVAGTHEPITLISRGGAGVPARYIVRNPSGQVMYDVRSSTVVYDRASDGSAQATFTQPHVIFHARDGRIVVADSPKAVAHDRDKSVVMTGGVRAKTGDGKVLTCATLTYDERNAQIQCSGDVVLTDTKTNQSASGATLLTDPGFEHVTLSGSK